MCGIYTYITWKNVIHMKMENFNSSISLEEHFCWVEVCIHKEQHHIMIFSLLAFKGGSLHHRRFRRHIPLLRLTPKTLGMRELLVLSNH